MSPIQQMLLGAGGAVATKTYVDDIFSTYVYAGNSTARSINNGLDLSGEGGMVWIKSRDNAYDHYIVDTERGALNRIRSNSDGVSGSAAQTLTAFNNNGFALGTDSINLVVNASNKTYTSWSFRKAPGFFDIVKFTGSGSSNSQQISHSLGCKPGMFMVKRLDSASGGTGAWWTWHHSIWDTTNYRSLKLDSDAAASGWGVFWDSGFTPTSSSFFVRGDANVLDGEYVCYLFAGNTLSSATGARSVQFDGTNNEVLKTAADSDFAFGTGNFTAEAFFKVNGGTGTWQAVVGTRLHNSNNDGSGWSIGVSSNRRITLYSSGFHVYPTDTITYGKWHHIAVVRSGTGSNETKMYLDGAEIGQGTCSNDLTNNKVGIGNLYGEGGNEGNEPFNGLISNLRLVKGTAVYTSAFTAPTAPLTNITNTKLLCCNNTSVTGSTVTSGTLSVDGTLAASSDNPFVDATAGIFGTNEDQGVISCGSYVGNGSSTGPEVFIGWEAQWVMVKRAIGGTEGWAILDIMRGWTNDAADSYLRANSTADEETGTDGRANLTSTGFNINSPNAEFNADGNTYVYMAIRRPDFGVGKPAEAGTDVFQMVTGTSNSDIPAFVSGFPVDFALARQPATSESWSTNARLMGTNQLKTDTNAAQGTDSDMTFDFNNGFFKNTSDMSAYQAWMWKRHAGGFDVVGWRGRGGSQTGSTAHSLGVVPEMIWSKRRDGDPGDWLVYHKGLNGGTNPEQYYLNLNDNGAEDQAPGAWNDTAPTATHFSTGAWSAAGAMSTTNYMITMLFASVNGISKVGYFDGQDSTITITTGFAPRFLIIKRITGPDGWLVFDTTRGWGSGNDYRLMLDSSTSQSAPVDYGAPTSTGFTMTTRDSTNASGEKYIYYAHA